MRYIYIILIVIGVYAAFIFGRIIYAAHFSGIPKIEHDEKVLGNGEELRYIVAGDSIMLGLGASSEEETAAYKIAKELSNKYKVNYKNIAVKGAQTKDVLDEQLPQIISYNPDIIVITVGGNDVIRLKSKKRTIEGYEEILNELSEKTDAKIYIANIPYVQGIKIFPSWYGALIGRLTVSINKEIYSIDNDRVSLVDAYGAYQAAENIDRSYAEDGVHANDLGYTLWAETFLEKIGESF